MASNNINSALVDHIAQLCNDYKTGRAGAREGLIESCTKLLPQLMTPEETMVMTTWAQPTHKAAIRLGVEMHLFEALAADNGSPKSSSTIADSMTPPAEHALVARVLRHLATMGSVLETGPDTFAPTPYALALTKENYRESIEFVEDDWQPLHQASPEFFRQNGFKSPTLVDSPFQLAYDCKGQHLFEFLGTTAPQRGKPLMGKKFGSIMQVWSTGRPKWFREDYYPVRERLIAGAKPNAPFFVDVGGNMGYDVTLLKAAFGNEMKGDLIVQDRPEIVALAEKSLEPGITAMAHDFLTEQPVKGTTPELYLPNNFIADRRQVHGHTTSTPSSKIGTTQRISTSYAPSCQPWRRATRRSSSTSTLFRTRVHIGSRRRSIGS